MARVLQEFFEAAGYDAAGWTESVPGTCIVNEDAASSGAGNPVGWGNQCLGVSLDGGGVDCYSYNSFGEAAIRYFAADFKVSSLAFDTDSQQCSVFYVLNGALSVVCGLVQLVRSAGQNLIQLFVYHDGTAHAVYAEPLVIDKLYRWELKWDSTADTYEVWLNNISRGSGALTGAAAATLAGTIVCGDLLNSVRTAVFRIDRVEVDNAARIGGYTLGAVLGQAVETDAAQAIAHAKAKAVGQAQETGIAQAVSRLKSKGIGLVLEIDAAQAIAHAKAKGIGQALETDAALPVTRLGGVDLLVDPRWVVAALGREFSVTALGRQYEALAAKRNYEVSE